MNSKKISTFFVCFGFAILSACSNVPQNQHQNYNNYENKTFSDNKELRSELPKKNFNADSIFYESFSATPSNSEMAKLDSILTKQAARLKGNSKQAIKLVGYTDDEGSSSYNLALAQQRIDFIAEKLRKMGVKWQQIQRYPVGAEKSHCGEDNNCKKLMRRVDLIPLEY